MKYDHIVVGCTFVVCPVSVCEHHHWAQVVMHHGDRSGCSVHYLVREEPSWRWQRRWRLQRMKPQYRWSISSSIVRGWKECALLLVTPGYGVVWFVKYCSLQPLFVINDDIVRVVKGPFLLCLKAVGRCHGGTDWHKSDDFVLYNIIIR